MLRSKEVRRFAAVFGVVSLVFVVIAFCIAPLAGLLALAFAAAVGVLFWRFTAARYARLAELAEEIDRLLHEEDRLFVADAEEGELAVLQSQLAKMTLRLREQNDALKREKVYLADSLADIAHQLRTPLTSVNLVFTLLKDEPDPARRRELLREGTALLAQMDWLLTTLLKISRLDAGVIALQCEPVPLAALVDTAAEPLRIPLELHTIALDVQIPPTAAWQVDRLWLAEALRNILKNCMEHTPDGGCVTVKCDDNPLFTALTIHDSGPGFDEAELPHLFDRFYRGKGSGTGYGIGLALAQSIITRQGGTITAKNAPEGGAVFVVQFEK
ncbi:sensor histidine kinase [Gemmiger sp.]